MSETATDATEAVLRAYERTVADRTARVTLARDRDWTPPLFPSRRSGGLLTPVSRAAKWGGKTVVKRAFGDMTEGFKHQEADGVIDFAGPRYAVDYGSFAILFAGDQKWSGRSGRALATLPAEADREMEPLWLVYVLGGVTGATEQGEDDVGRRLSVTVDMSRASAARPGGLSVPASDRFEDLLALRFDVWIDATHVRRVQFMRPVCEGATCGSTVNSLDLHEFGVDVDSLDWSRLPTLKSPREAADLAAWQAKHAAG